MFIYRAKVHLHQTDAAGMLFYGHLFAIINEALEAALESVGLPVGEILAEGGFLLPIVHAEADFHLPVLVGDLLEVRVALEKTGRSSLTFRYDVLSQRLEDAATARTVHAAVDRKTLEKTALPEILREKLESLFREDAREA